MIDMIEYMNLAEKAKRGEELTEAEKHEALEFTNFMLEAFRPVFEALLGLMDDAAKALMNWFQSLPNETQSMIKQSVDEPLKGRQQVLQEGLLYGSESTIGRRVEINIHNARSVERLTNEMNKQQREIYNEQLG